MDEPIIVIEELDPNLLERIRQAAEDRGISPTQWLNQHLWLWFVGG